MKKIKSKNKVLAYGEKTFHHHSVEVDVYEREDGLKEFSGKTDLTHQEHGKISIADGEYLSGQVNEFDHLNKLVRKVVD